MKLFNEFGYLAFKLKYKIIRIIYISLQKIEYAVDNWDIGTEDQWRRYEEETYHED